MKAKVLFSSCLAAVLALLLLPITAFADPAMVIHDFGCIALDGDGNFVVADGRVSVQNHGGNITAVCKAKNVGNSTG